MRGCPDECPLPKFWLSHPYCNRWEKHLHRTLQAILCILDFFPKNNKKPVEDFEQRSVMWFVIWSKNSSPFLTQHKSFPKARRDHLFQVADSTSQKKAASRVWSLALRGSFSSPWALWTRWSYPVGSCVPASIPAHSSLDAGSKLSGPTTKNAFILSSVLWEEGQNRPP